VMFTRCPLTSTYQWNGQDSDGVPHFHLHAF
jgi:hypothetical protein